MQSLQGNPMYSIAIHGGAGGVPAELLATDQGARYTDSLGKALDAGYAVLERGGSSLDAVTTAVRALEDDPLFNAGHGAALTREGWAELDAAVMDGKDQRAGAVASVRHVKNPVDLARRVMEKSRHVLLVSTGAEEFALEEGIPLVANHYFRTAERRLQLAAEQQGRTVSDLMPATSGLSTWELAGGSGGAPTGRRAKAPMGWLGTVGAVACDRDGNLAAATSTGGMTNKRQGRVGDSPIIGAGTYAKNGVCALSATGHGEYFIRAVAAYHVACAVEYRNLPLEAAVRELIHSRIPALGGSGGVIACGARGELVMDFNTEGMFRAARDSTGQRQVAIGR
ncbi:MAG TPA: isoaspartyl peptidase/L-asparaginase [Steroidobacteraceae bacterium]|nr:isoaspartyl peptidase/L-asparaginase [Steroidobacteraceae bacterium]